MVSVRVRSGADFDVWAQLMSLLVSAVSVEDIAVVDLLALLFSVPSASQSSESKIAHTRLNAAVSVEEIAEVDLLVLFSAPSASQSSESHIARPLLVAAPQWPEQVLVTSNLRYRYSLAAFVKLAPLFLPVA